MRTSRLLSVGLSDRTYPNLVFEDHGWIWLTPADARRAGALLIYYADKAEERETNAPEDASAPRSAEPA